MSPQRPEEDDEPNAWLAPALAELAIAVALALAIAAAVAHCAPR